MDSRTTCKETPKVLILFVIIGLCCAFPWNLQAQRIFDTEYLAREMGLEQVIPKEISDDNGLLTHVLDSLEEHYQLDSSDYAWLCVQPFRAIVLLRTEGKESAANHIGKCLETPAARRNNFATRALLTLHMNCLYEDFAPNLVARGVASMLLALEYARAVADKQIEFDISVFVASIYIDVLRRDLAREWLDQAAEILPEINDPFNCHLYYVHSADALNPEKWTANYRLIWPSLPAEKEAIAQIDKAIACGEEAYRQGYQLGTNVGLAYHIKSSYCLDPRDEIANYKKSILYSREMGKAVLGESYAYLARIYIESGELDSAMIYMDSSRVLETEYGDSPPLMERFYFSFVRYYTVSEGQADSLVKYQRLYYRVRLKGTEAKALAEMEAERYRYQQSRQQLTIQAQRSEIEAREMRNRNLILSLGGLGIILVLTLFSGIRIRQRNKIIQDKNRQIGGMVDKLKLNLTEKTMLIQEVNHRVKNNLQMITAFIDIQAQHVSEEETKVFAEGIRKRIRAVNLVHELIVDEEKVSGKGFSEYAQQLIHELKALYYKDKEFLCHIDITKEQFSISSSVYLGIMLNELVVNSMKYAAKEGESLQIWVSLHREGNKFVFTYRDSGKGLPGETIAESRKGTSLGLKLVEMMARQLEGILTYKPGSQHAFRFEFPDPELGE